MKSVIMNPYCSETAAKDAMEAVWDVCYNDTQPFDRAPWNMLITTCQCQTSCPFQFSCRNSVVADSGFEASNMSLFLSWHDLSQSESSFYLDSFSIFSEI